MVMMLALEFRLAFLFFAYLIFSCTYYIALSYSLYKANVLNIKKRKEDMLF